MAGFEPNAARTLTPRRNSVGIVLQAGTIVAFMYEVWAFRQFDHYDTAIPYFQHQPRNNALNALAVTWLVVSMIWQVRHFPKATPEQLAASEVRVKRMRPYLLASIGVLLILGFWIVRSNIASY